MKNKSLTNNTLRIAYEYTNQLAKQQPYKIQFIKIRNEFEKGKGFRMNRHYKAYMNSTPNKNLHRDFRFVRDFSFKNDYMTPRQSVIFWPKAYIYYTFHAFLLMRLLDKKKFRNSKNTHVLDFSRERIKIFYAGLVDYSSKNIPKNCGYANCYEEFQRSLKTFQGSRVLKIDIQDFFSGITIRRLKNLKKYLNENYILITTQQNVEFNKIIKFYELSGYSSLPQSQGSLASSIMSQLYLYSFTQKLESIAEEKDLQIIRYVDDMYIKLPDGFTDKNAWELISEISSLLWKVGLSINSTKTKIYDKEEFQKEAEYNGVTVSGRSIRPKLLISKQIEERVQAILSNDGEKLLSFFKAVSQLDQEKGNDLRSYHSLVQSYFSINNDNVNKVQNALIFGKEWNKLSLKAKSEMLKHPEVLSFDPGKYVYFLLMVEKKVNILTQQQPLMCIDSYIEGVLKKVSDNDYGVREALMETNYYIQKRKSTKDFLEKQDKFQKLSPNFFNYVKSLI